MSRGQRRIYDTGFSVAEPRDEVTVCVDDRGDPCVCGPDDGKPLGVLVLTKLIEWHRFGVGDEKSFFFIVVGKN